MSQTTETRMKKAQPARSADLTRGAPMMVTMVAVVEGAAADRTLGAVAAPMMMMMTMVAGVEAVADRTQVETTLAQLLAPAITTTMPDRYR